MRITLCPSKMAGPDSVAHQRRLLANALLESIPVEAGSMVSARVRVTKCSRIARFSEPRNYSKRPIDSVPAAARHKTRTSVTFHPQVKTFACSITSMLGLTDFAEIAPHPAVPVQRIARVAARP